LQQWDNSILSAINGQSEQWGMTLLESTRMSSEQATSGFISKKWLFSKGEQPNLCF
jgi:hypothetical protein